MKGLLALTERSCTALGDDSDSDKQVSPLLICLETRKGFQVVQATPAHRSSSHPYCLFKRDGTAGNESMALHAARVIVSIQLILSIAISLFKYYINVPALYGALCQGSHAATPGEHQTVNGVDEASSDRVLSGSSTPY